MHKILYFASIYSFILVILLNIYNTIKFITFLYFDKLNIGFYLIQIM